jgi:nucleotide-binding universal stress UspA family protein
MNANIRSILVPVDFSAHSDRAVAYAAHLAKQLNASVELLHVVNDPVLAGAWGTEVYVPDLTDLLAALTTDAETRLAVTVTALRAQGLAASSAVRQGISERTILEHLTAGRFDLAVIGSHGRTGLSHAVMGSVAERVLRHAPCPVLIVTANAAQHLIPAAAA